MTRAFERSLQLACGAVDRALERVEALARVLWAAYDWLGAELLDEPVIFG